MVPAEILWPGVHAGSNLDAHWLGHQRIAAGGFSGGFSKLQDASGIAILTTANTFKNALAISLMFLKKFSKMENNLLYKQFFLCY